MSNTHRKDYLVKKTYTSYVTVSILTSLTATVGILIDNIIAGQLLGQDALGAMGIVGPISIVFSALGNIAASGGTAIAARTMGRGDRERVNRIFTITVLFVLFSGLLLTIPGLLFPHEIAILLGARGDLLPLSEAYIFGFFLGAIPTMLTTALLGFIKLDGSPRLPLVAISLMSVVNIVLDIVMVIVFELDMLGMALATSISYCVAVLIAGIHFLKPISTLRLVKPTRMASELVSMICTGLPTAAIRLCETGKAVILNVLLVSVIGVGAVAALNVRNQANNLLGTMTMGVGQAVIPVAGLFYGEEDQTSLGITVKSGLKIGLVLNCVTAVALLAFPGFLPKILGVTEPEAMQMAKMAVILFAVAMPLRGINLVLMNYYQATERVNLSLAIGVLESFVYTVLLSLLLISPLGSNGVWIAFVAAEILTLVTVLAVILGRIRRFPRCVQDLLLLPAGFGSSERKVEFSVGNSLEAVGQISQRFHEFCKSRQVSDRLAGHLGLCLEELGSNIVQHAFTPGSKQWMDITVVDRETELLISFRDNGKPFDPTMYSPQADRYGLPLVRGIAREFTYRRSLDINVVTVKLDKN